MMPEAVNGTEMTGRPSFSVVCATVRISWLRYADGLRGDVHAIKADAGDVV